MNEAKLLLWGKGDVEEWNSHKCHQRLVKSFGQISRPEMVLLEYSNFLDQLLHKSCGTETISNHRSKGDMRELNRGVFENPSQLPLWLYLVRIKSYTKTPEYDETLTNTSSCKQEVCARLAWVPFCLSKRRHQLGRRAGTVRRPYRSQPRKQAALTHENSTFVLKGIRRLHHLGLVGGKYVQDRGVWRPHIILSEGEEGIGFPAKT